MPRRFIAGAVCPRCGEMDKLVVDSDADTRECVRCGYGDERPGDADNRPGGAAARLVETPTEKLRLLSDKPGQNNSKG